MTIFCTNHTFVLFLDDQVEHAHDNPVDEITLGECDMAAPRIPEAIPSEKPVTLKTMDLDIDKELELKCEVESDVPVEERKTKKKKDKDKRKTLCAVLKLHK